MRRFFLAAIVSLLGAPLAHATPGLELSIYNNSPFYEYYPTSSDIDSEIAYAAGTTPDSQQILAVSPSSYSLNVGNYTAANFTGSLIVGTAGMYTFAVNADDAARVSVDGNTLVESDFWNGGLNYPNTSQVYLTAGAHSYDAFYFQTIGGANFDTEISNGPDSLSFDSAAPASNVPEPVSISLLGAGLISLGWIRRRA